MTARSRHRRIPSGLTSGFTGCSHRTSSIHCRLLLIGFLAYGFILQEGQAIKWLATGGVQWNSTDECLAGGSNRPGRTGKTDGRAYTTSATARPIDVDEAAGSSFSPASVLTRPQRLVCSRHVDLMNLVSLSARLTVDLCQELFADRRWNCSSIQLAPNFAPDLTAGSREQAFVYALSSATLVHTVAKACATGQSSKCHCAAVPDDEPPPRGHRWGGCGDDTQFAASFGRQFTASAASERPSKRRKMPSKRTLTNRHNNAAGISILASSLKTTCKCHGVSGACTVKTCWKSLPVMRTIAAAIQARHVTAVHVRRTGKREESGGTERQLIAAGNGNGATATIGADVLVYYTISPDYCLPDAALGSFGTQDRECRPDDEGAPRDGSGAGGGGRMPVGSSGCRSMCCGRGHVTVLTNVTRRCDCKYYWCCYVRCRTCTHTILTHRCR